MKTKLAKFVDVQVRLTREQALRYIKCFKNDENVEGSIRSIERQLETIYIYKVKCCGCGNKINYSCYGTMTPQKIEDMEEYFLCDPCYDSEDFK